MKKILKWIDENIIIIPIIGILIVLVFIMYIAINFSGTIEAADIIAAISVILTGIISLTSIYYVSNTSEKQIQVALGDRRVSSLTKYRMEWLRNLKDTYVGFLSTYESIFHLQKTKDNDLFNKSIASSIIELRKFRSFLNSELSVKGEIDKQILFKLNTLLEKNIQVSQTQTCDVETLVNKHESLLDENVISIYRRSFDAYSNLYKQKGLSKEQKELAEDQIGFEYHLILPDVRPELFKKLQVQLKPIFEDLNSDLRAYFKVEWERIKTEINDNTNAPNKFDFNKEFEEYRKNM